jgi:hypothetical protein
MGMIYGDVGTLMTEAFSAGKIAETRRHWANFKKKIAAEGKEYSFGEFGAYLFAQWGVYDSTEHTKVPRSRSQWNGSTATMPAEVRANLGRWIPEALENGTKPVTFFIGEHEGETTADRFESETDVFLVVMCKARAAKSAQVENLQRMAVTSDKPQTIKA